MGLLVLLHSLAVPTRTGVLGWVSAAGLVLPGQRRSVSAGLPLVSCIVLALLVTLLRIFPDVCYRLSQDFAVWKVDSLLLRRIPVVNLRWALYLMIVRCRSPRTVCLAVMDSVLRLQTLRVQSVPVRPLAGFVWYAGWPTVVLAASNCFCK